MLMETMKNRTLPYLQLSTQFQPQNIYPGIPESISKKYDVVPLWADGDHYVLGTADHAFENISDLERLLKRPVSLYCIPYLSLQKFQHVLYDDPNIDFPQADYGELYRRLNGEPQRREVREKSDQKENEGNRPLPSLTPLEKADLECQGVYYQLPHLDLGETAIKNDLASLIPMDVARKFQVIPLWWLGGRLFVGCNGAALENNISQLNNLFNFNVRLVICSERQWKNAFRRIYLEGQKRRELSDQMIVDYCQGHFSLDANDVQRARVYATQYRVNIIDAFITLGIISIEKLQDAKSALTGIPVMPPGTSLDPECKWLLPESLAEELGVIILKCTETSVQIAGVEISKEKIAALQTLTQRTVIPYLISSEQLQTWINQVYADRSNHDNKYFELSFQDILLTLEILTQKQLQEVDGMSTIEDELLGRRLIARGYLDEGDLPTLFSLQTGIPAVSFDHSIIDHQFLQGFSQELVRNYSLIPFYETGEAIWIATPYPFNGKGFNQFKRNVNKQVFPVLAPAKVLQAVIEKTWGVSKQTIDEGSYHSVQELINSDFLTQTQANQMIQLMAENKLAFDEAFKQASRYDGTQVNQILGRVFSIPTFDTKLIEEQREEFDGMGNRITRTFYRDPVERKTAGLVDAAFANQYMMLPIRKEGQHVMVAFADPMTAQNLPFFEERLGASIHPSLVARAELQEAITRTLGRKNIGTYLLENSYITRRQLNEALELSQQTGVRLGQALLIKQFIHEKQIYEILAQQAGLKFVDLKGVCIQEDVVRLVDAEIEREYGVLPIKATKTELTLAIVDPIDKTGIEKVKEITGKKVRLVVTSEEGLEHALESIYSTDYTITSTSNLLTRSPRESAFKVLSRGQSIFFSVLFFLSLIWAILDFTSFTITVNELVTVFYIGFSAYKFYLVYSAMNHDCEVPVSDEELAALDPKQLPVYTLLVPVYKEADVLPNLMKSLTRLDYPSTKLDIKILMEEDDTETIQRFYELNLPPHFKATIVPGSQPRTKPKACNYGLIHAKGEYIVIFDAEDRPDRDQLKKAVVAFEKSDPQVVCIQAKLNYYNRTQNLLTQWFTSEYSMWFDLFLPGLDASEAPIPLGGTSNHFKRRALAEVGAWDPHNVTEDADLGMRLYKRGFHTRTIDSTTYEEANSRLNNWLRQRSRWIKGYIQTWLVHMRDPFKLLREVGLKGFISFQFVTGGTFFAALVNPVLWTITTVWFLTKWAFIQETFPGVIFYLSSISLYLGNFVFTYMNVAGAMRRKHYDNVRFALLSPIYWGLMSIGAWKGFLQLISKPHYWEKTIHGFSQEKGLDEDEGSGEEENSAS